MKGFEILAKFMHDEYEKEAVNVGWNTQDKCKVEFENLPEKNKTVMLAIAKKVIESFFGDSLTKLNCIQEELDRFEDDTTYTSKQYSDSIMRIKGVMKYD